MIRTTKARRSHGQGQGMVEFALALPILLLVVFGLLEVGRAVFMYAAVVNASREAVRYATAYGVDASNVLHVQNCAEIRATAKRVAFLVPLQDDDIVIEYDEGPGTSVVAECASAETVDTTINLACGDRVNVTVSYDYQPIVPFVPQLTDQTFSSSSARTFLGVIELTDPPAACD